MAITANELRIGNYLTYNGKEIAVSPLAINEFYYLGDTHAKSEIDKREYLPIQITEERLLKLGFINDDAQRYFKDGIYLILYDEGCTILHNQIHINYFYVHQLQNLYFALTGKELIYGNNPD